MKYLKPNSYTGQKASQLQAGQAKFATESQAIAGLDDELIISPKTMAAAVDDLMPDASTTVKGKIQLATNAESVTGSNAAKAIVPSSLTARLAAPGAIGGTTPAAGSFTTLSATSTVSAGTTLTATLGNITATNGNLSLATAGNKIIIATGSNASVGVSGAMSGTPGVVTVATTACSATAKIFYSRATTGGTAGNVSITAQDGTGFTLTSTANETSTFNWWIINA